MQVGLIGAGNMARALALGWGEPVICSDAGSGRAAMLAAELGGEALGSNAEVARRSDLVVLCHKPGQLLEVADEIRADAKAVVSVLGGTTVEMLESAYPGIPVVLAMPNTPVQVRRGIVCYTLGHEVDSELERRVVALFERLGDAIKLPEQLIGPASALMGVGPAYQALLTEAQVDAGVRRGLKAPLAGRLVVGTMAGTAELLRARDCDTLAVRREVTSPGGSTARGLAALERGGIRDAFDAAIDAVLDGSGR